MSSPWSQAPRFETQKCLPPHPPPLHVQTFEPLSALAGVCGGFLEPKRALPPALGWVGGSEPSALGTSKTPPPLWAFGSASERGGLKSIGPEVGVVRALLEYWWEGAGQKTVTDNSG